MDKISHSVEKTTFYTDDVQLPERKSSNLNPTLQLLGLDSLSAAITQAKGICCILNYADYKTPGGKFLDGSSAQEECLCHESTLYNVLEKHGTFYSYNKDYMNKGLYTNRALYSEDVLFLRDGKDYMFDVITCAAPNYGPGRRYGTVTPEENANALYDRIKFVLDVAEYNEVSTLILGAYGCGVFKQDPTAVASYFLGLLSMGNYHFKKVIFAIPDEYCKNYKAFKNVLGECLV